MPEFEPEQIYDPIAEALPLMAAAARRHCPVPEDGRASCQAYHLVWPYLRRLGLFKGPIGDAAILLDKFKELAGTGGYQRVLISGSADYSLLALILHAYRAQGKEPEVTVLDLCESPLVINQWYAEKMGARISTRACDILRFSPDRDYDLITAHLLLSHIPAPLLGRVISKWRELLRPGGQVVGAQLLFDERPMRSREDQLKFWELRRRRVQTIMRENPGLIDVSEAEMDEMITNWHNTKGKSILLLKADFQKLMHENGFSLELGAGIDLGKPEPDLPFRPSKRYPFVAVKKG